MVKVKVRIGEELGLGLGYEFGLKVKVKVRLEGDGMTESKMSCPRLSCAACRRPITSLLPQRTGSDCTV